MDLISTQREADLEETLLKGVRTTAVALTLRNSKTRKELTPEVILAEVMNLKARCMAAKDKAVEVMVTEVKVVAVVIEIVEIEAMVATETVVDNVTEAVIVAMEAGVVASMEAAGQKFLPLLKAKIRLCCLTISVSKPPLGLAKFSFTL